MHFEKMTQNIFLESVKTRQKSQKKTLDKIPTLCYNIRVLRSDAPREPAVLAQLDRVPGYEPVGRGFESLTPCQNKSPMACPWVFCFTTIWSETPVQVVGVLWVAMLPICSGRKERRAIWSARAEWSERTVIPMKHLNKCLDKRMSIW